jgi:hydrogenase maturation protein HypF
MLPYSPLHHLLLGDLGFPVVATSGNLSDEPICIDEREAVERLRGIADAFLVHDRPIARHVDDSVVRIAMGRELVLRRGRGFAPLPVAGAESATALLAVGGHLKSAVAVTNGGSLILSQHLGDLETAPAHAAFRKAIGDLETLYEQRAERVVCDLHPDYRSTRFARRGAAPVHAVQHHHAHVAACMADNDLEGSVLGVAWDGAGLGPDGTVWGGEFLRADRADFTRLAHLRSFRLPGGDAAAREPRRAALGVLFEIWGEAALERDDLPPVAAFTPAERRVLREMLDRGLHSPITSSAGRLFDAVAALIGLRQRASFEGQAASELEFAALRGGVRAPYRFRLAEPDGPAAPSGPDEAACSVDWEPLIRDVLADCEGGVPREEIAARFHESLAAIVAAVAERCGERRVVLSGGCFQNAFLTERAVARLEAAGLRAFWHQRIPPNDGGIAAGQAVVALASEPKES